MRVVRLMTAITSNRSRVSSISISDKLAPESSTKAASLCHILEVIDAGGKPRYRDCGFRLWIGDGDLPHTSLCEGLIMCSHGPSDLDIREDASRKEHDSEKTSI